MRSYRRIVIVGGGSMLWTPEKVGMMAVSQACREAEVVLVDIALEKAARMAELCTRMIARGYPGIGLRVTAAATLDEALPGADAVMTCYCNLGLQIEGKLNAIAQRYGSHQCCFTAGPGAMLYVCTQAPTMVRLVEAMQRHCPDAWLVNCSNPLPAMVMVAVKAGADPRRVLGFCGALHWSRTQLAGFLGVAPERVQFRIGGTNHCTFFTEVRVDGEDGYPLLRRRAREVGYLDLGCWGRSTTEIHFLETLGLLPCGGHATDIFPEIHGEWLPPLPTAPPKPDGFAEGFAERFQAYCMGNEVNWRPPAAADVPVTWLDALAGAPGDRLFSVNFTNFGAVPNLPDWSVPDLECHLDARGITPLASSPLPEHVAEVVRRHQMTFEMVARAAVTRDRDLLLRAIQLQPFGNYLESAERIVADARAEFGEELILQ